MTTERNTNVEALLNTVMTNLRLPNDAALARALDVGPSMISKLRHGRSNVTADLLLRIHEETNLPIRTLKSMLADGGIPDAGKALDMEIGSLQVGATYRIATKDWLSPLNERIPGSTKERQFVGYVNEGSTRFLKLARGDGSDHLLDVDQIASVSALPEPTQA